MGKYGEIIYTRAGAAYDMRGGELPQNNGYAVYNISEDLFNGASDGMVEFFRTNALQLYKYLRCPVDSYYAHVTAPEGGMALLGRFTPRTREDAEAAAAARVDTRSSHVAQFLAGNFGRRPFEYMESPFFDAHKLPIADYYGRACAKRPPLMEDVEPGPLGADAIAKFVSDGRREAVMTAAAKLLEMNDCEPAQQKTIVIQDEEANVRLWIAAITALLPLHVARDLSFCTSAMDLAEQGALVRGDQLVWRLAGAVPGDATSAIPRPVPLSLPVLILDGRNRKAEFSAAQDIVQSALIARAGTTDSNLQILDNLCEEIKDAPKGAKLCELYEAALAVNFLQDLNYDEMLRTLSVLLPHAMPNTSLASALEEFLIAANGYRDNLANADAQNRLAILNLLMSHAAALGWQKDRLAAIATAAAENAIANPDCSLGFLEKIAGFFVSGNEIYTLARDRIFGERRLSCMDPARFGDYSEKQLQTLLNMLASFVRGNAPWDDLLQTNDTLSEFVDFCLQREDTALYLLDLFRQDVASMAFLIRRGAKAAGKGSEECRKWQRLLAARANIPAELVCRSLAASKEQAPADVAAYLGEYVRRKGLSSDIIRLYGQYSGDGEAGAEFRDACAEFGAAAPLGEILLVAKDWLEMLKKHPGDCAAAAAILDARIELSKAGFELAAAINAHAGAGAHACGRSACLAFLEECKKNSEGTEGPASLYLRFVKPGQTLHAPAGFVEHESCKSLLAWFADNADKPEISLLAAGAMNFATEAEEGSWLKNYAGELARRFLKNRYGGLVALCTLTTDLEKGRPLSESGECLLSVWSDKMPAVLKNLGLMRDYCVNALSQSKSVKAMDKFPEGLQKKYRLEALAELKSILEEAGELYDKRPRGFFGKMLDGIFGK